jgi:hypothetical protein
MKNHFSVRFVIMVFCSWLAADASSTAANNGPSDNPVAKRYAENPSAVPAWVNELPWNRVVAIGNSQGQGDDERLAAAQQALAAKGGGVIYFPAGVYTFRDHIDLQNGIILRGADPPQGDAKSEKYAPPTQFEFPKYRPSMEGAGTPIDTAFKAIRVADAAKTSNCGVVNIAVNRGHVYFAEDEGHHTGCNRLAFGCLLTNTAAADPTVPNTAYSHRAHQRWIHRHRAAIDIHAGENIFIANNRIPRSGDDNFVVKPYTLIKVHGTGQLFRIEKPNKRYEVFTIQDGVEFDYDNRPGIYANLFGITGPGADKLGSTPEKEQPYCFRKGTIIRDNYIYCSGRSAITFCGDGAYCAYNVIRFPAGVQRLTTTGLVVSDGSATNDNRAVTMRGYRWHVEGNDYEVHSNMAFEKGIKINDGEGIMHEAYQNSAVRDGKIVGNRGNRYLCFWTTDIDGLLIQGNHISAGGAAVHVLGSGRTIKNVRILGNELSHGGIKVSTGSPENIEIRQNRFSGSGVGRIEVDNPDWAKDNVNFTVERPQPRAKRK